MTTLNHAKYFLKLNIDKLNFVFIYFLPRNKIIIYPWVNTVKS
jgi:hypothetical protein